MSGTPPEPFLYQSPKARLACPSPTQGKRARPGRWSRRRFLADSLGDNEAITPYFLIDLTVSMTARIRRPIGPSFLGGVGLLILPPRSAIWISRPALISPLLLMSAIRPPTSVRDLHVATDIDIAAEIQINSGAGVRHLHTAKHLADFPMNPRHPFPHVMEVALQLVEPFRMPDQVLFVLRYLDR